MCEDTLTAPPSGTADVTTTATAAAPSAPIAADACAVVELRQYTLHPQQREVLIDLFDREFVETQEAQGMRVLGQFRDLDRPDLFVWLRGFASMQARRQALEAFYGGPTWAAHRSAANATMIDSDNVLLLRPAWPGAAAALPQHPRPAPGAAAASGAAPGLLAATVFHLHEAATPALLDFAATAWRPCCSAAARGRWRGTAPRPAPTPFRACRCAKANTCCWHWRCLAANRRRSRLPPAAPGSAVWRRAWRPGCRARARPCACSPPRAARCTPEAPTGAPPWP